MGYFPEPDHTGHETGPYNSTKVQEMLVQVDTVLGTLFDGLLQRNLMNCINLILVADHGMDSISAEQTFFVDDLITEEKFPELDLSHDVYIREGVPGQITNSVQSEENFAKWSSELAEEIKNELDCNLPGEHSRAFLKGVDTPKRLHYMNNDRIADVLLNMEAQWSVKRSNSGWMPEGGNHGFDNEYNAMHALFLGYGAAFKNGYYDETVHQNIELYDMMCGIMNVEPSPNNGTRGALDHVLVDGYKRMEKDNVFKAEELNNVETYGYDRVCDRCTADDLYEIYGKTVADMNTELYMSQNEKIEIVSEKMPFLIDLKEKYVLQKDGSEISYEILPQTDFVTVRDSNQNLKAVSFNVDDKATGIPTNKVKQCVRIDPRSLDLSEESEDFCNAENNNPFYLFPLSKSSNPIAQSEAILNTNIIKSGGKSLQTFYEKVVEKFFRGWASNSINGVLNIMAGPIFDNDLDGNFDANVDENMETLTHLFLIVSDIGRDEEINRNSKIMSFVIPNWPNEPCDFDVDSVEYLQSILEMHVSTVNDIELLTGLKFKYNQGNNDEESEVSMKLKMKLPQWSTDFWDHSMETGTDRGA